MEDGGQTLIGVLPYFYRTPAIGGKITIEAGNLRELIAVMILNSINKTKCLTLTNMAGTAKVKTGPTKKILVVEDEGEIALVLDMILGDKNLQSDYVNTLLAATEYLSAKLPSLIILDNQLPDGFGVDFISYIKDKFPSIKIIMITGFATVRDVAIANGADAFFEKPFSLDEFYEAIDRLLA
jgi:two-component system, OmpR family, response regulator